MGNLPMGGCVTPVSVMRDVLDSLGLHWNQKDLKSGKKRPLSYGQFTNGRLRDSSEYHVHNLMYYINPMFVLHIHK